MHTYTDPRIAAFSSQSFLSLSKYVAARASVQGFCQTALLKVSFTCNSVTTLMHRIRYDTCVYMHYLQRLRLSIYRIYQRDIYPLDSLDIYLDRKKFFFFYSLSPFDRKSGFLLQSFRYPVINPFSAIFLLLIGGQVAAFTVSIR